MVHIILFLTFEDWSWNIVMAMDVVAARNNDDHGATSANWIWWWFVQMTGHSIRKTSSKISHRSNISRTMTSWIWFAVGSNVQLENAALAIYFNAFACSPDENFCGDDVLRCGGVRVRSSSVSNKDSEIMPINPQMKKVTPRLSNTDIDEGPKKIKRKNNTKQTAHEDCKIAIPMLTFSNVKFQFGTKFVHLDWTCCRLDQIRLLIHLRE